MFASRYLVKDKTIRKGTKMNKLELYESALVQLAEEGNEKAKMILLMGNTACNHGQFDTKAVAADIRRAIDSIGQALEANGYEWTRRTDTHMQSALSSLTGAMSKLVN
jgi:hypothetical protein